MQVGLFLRVKQTSVGEVARVELHEETPEIRKETVVREEVRVKKVVDRDTVEAQETVRREELDINAPNLPIEER
jgi:stress response protein YsnF